MTQDDFNSQWTLDNMPACPEGMRLLKIWCDGDLTVLPQVLRDPSLSQWPIAFATPSAIVFTKHRLTCEDCNA